MIDAIQTFVKDIVRRSKDIEKLIAALPNKDDSTERVGGCCCYSTYRQQEARHILLL